MSNVRSVLKTLRSLGYQATSNPTLRTPRNTATAVQSQDRVFVNVPCGGPESSWATTRPRIVEDAAKLAGGLIGRGYVPFTPVKFVRGVDRLFVTGPIGGMYV